MSKLFDISYRRQPRAVPRPFDEDDFADASRMFLALRRLLAREDGRFEIRVGSVILPFDFDPDLSTVFEDLPDVLITLKEEEGTPVELYFFEQGTDLTFTMARRKNEVELAVHPGSSTGTRYAKVSNEPVTVSLTQFLHAWARFLDDVLAALRQVDPGIERDEGYREYAARIKALGSSDVRRPSVADRLSELFHPVLAPLRRSPALKPASKPAAA